MKSPADLPGELTPAEKAELCSGQNFWQTRALPRLGIPARLLADGPHGVRKQAGDFAQVDIHGVPATCFPTAAALANSWDRDLLYEIGVALGEEARAEGVAVLLGPGVNIKRSPLCGRNFEYYSEDPLLAGELAAQWIAGVQSRGVGASLKHFAANNQEYRRMIIDAQVYLRALRELYLAPFEIAVRKARPRTVMAAYNRLNGEYCCENTWLLEQVLRREWGFQGLVVSDWGGCNDRVAGLRAGLDLEMPSSGGFNTARIGAALSAGELETDVLDRAVSRVLNLVAAAPEPGADGGRCDRAAHHALARRAAAESAVLLKNAGALLPLRQGARVAVIGDFARRPRYQGTGSSQITASQLDNALDALREEGLALTWAEGYRREDDAPDAALIEAACAAARAADVAVIFAGLPERCESEGFDRAHMRLPEAHDTLIARVAAVNPDTVVVLCGGAPVEMPWLDRVRAVIAAYLGGQAGGGAVADVLLGRVNPCGKLAESWPLQLSDTPAFHYFPGGPHAVEYRESLYVGYRYYAGAGKPVAFPFGHGISYTVFDYTELQITQPRISAGETLDVSVRVTNSGAVAGAEIVQLYVRDPRPGIFRPHRELKAFAKLHLRPGETRTAAFALDFRAFAYFDTQAGEWRVDGGEYLIQIGASSADIRLEAGVRIDAGPARESPLEMAPAGYRQLSSGELRIDDAAFQCVLGRAPADIWQGRGYHLNSLLGEVRGTWIGRLLYAGTFKGAQKMAAGSDDAVLAKMIDALVAEMPLRQLVAFSGGRLSLALMEALLALMNGRRLTGLRLLFAALRRS